MRGAGKRPVPYIVAQDTDLDASEQTITWVKPKNTKMGAYSSRRYTSAFGDSGEPGEYDPEEWYEALLGDFCECVVRIDNIAFSDEYLDAHPDVKGEVKENGFSAGPFTTPEVIREIAEDAIDGYVTEVVNAASNRVRLDRGAKKNLSWSQSLLSGDPLPQ